MIYTDIHTHHRELDKREILAIHSISDLNVETNPDTIYSIGIHPWYITEKSGKEEFEQLTRIAIQPNIVAIGECGIDKLCKTPYALQKKIFIKQIELSEKIRKPIIIHSVKSYNEVIDLHKEVKPSQTWIIHGYRGNEHTAYMLVRRGILLSIGEKFNKNLPTTIELSSIFLESDESKRPIEEIYASAAQAWKVELKQLTEETRDRFYSIFLHKNSLLQIDREI